MKPSNILVDSAGRPKLHSDPRKALAVYDHSLARLRETKINERAQRDEADLLASSSYAARRLHRTDEARQRIDSAFRLLRETGQYPADRIEPVTEPDHSLRALADHYAETGQPDKAVETYRELLARIAAWKPDPQNDLRDANSLSLAWAGLSGLLRRTGRADEAAVFDARRAGLWQEWNRKRPNNPFVLRQIAARVNY